jgi:hypothetical protein
MNVAELQAMQLGIEHPIEYIKAQQITIKCDKSIMKQIRLERQTSNKNTDGITFVVYVTVDLIISTSGGILDSLNCAKAVALFATVLVVYSK